MSPTPPGVPTDREGWLAALNREQELFTAAAGGGAVPGAAGAFPARAVPACPGWSVADLVSHVAGLYLRVAGILRRGGVTAPAPGAPVTGDPYAALARGWDELREAIAAGNAADPAWNWSPAPDTAEFWWRRMTHETLVHRLDVEQLTGQHSPVPAGLAADGVEEIFTVFLASGRAQRGWSGHPATVVVRAAVGEREPADGGSRPAGREWVVALGSEPPRLVADTTAAAEPPPGAVISGEALEVLRALWDRTDIAPLVSSGDLALARALQVG